MPTWIQRQVHLPCVLGQLDKSQRGSWGAYMLYEIASGGTFMELAHAWLSCNTCKSYFCLYLSCALPQSRGLWKPAKKGTFRLDESYSSESYCTMDGPLLPSPVSKYPSSDHTFAKRQGSTIALLQPFVWLCSGSCRVLAENALGCVSFLLMQCHP